MTCPPPPSTTLVITWATRILRRPSTCAPDTIPPLAPTKSVFDESANGRAPVLVVGTLRNNVTGHRLGEARKKTISMNREPKLAKSTSPNRRAGSLPHSGRKRAWQPGSARGRWLVEIHGLPPSQDCGARLRPVLHWAAVGYLSIANCLSFVSGLLAQRDVIAGHD